MALREREFVEAAFMALLKRRPDANGGRAYLRALRNGVEGTPMAPWTSELSEAELSAVAYYVREYFEGGPNR